MIGIVFEFYVIVLILEDDAVNDVLKDIIEAGGVVKSIFTQEPSLEDVFIKATAEVNEDDRA